MLIASRTNDTVVTQRRVRKTTQMQYLELKHSMRIDDLLLNVLISNNGVSLKAARELGLSPSAFSKWLLDLQLTEEVDEIRRSFNLPSTTTSQRMHIVREDNKLSIGESLTEVCQLHGENFDDLILPTLIGVSQGFKRKRQGKVDMMQQFVVILAEKQKHRFAIGSVKQE
jgi:hypothetical protein